MDRKDMEERSAFGPSASPRRPEGTSMDNPIISPKVALHRVRRVVPTGCPASLRAAVSATVAISPTWPDTTPLPPPSPLKRHGRRGPAAGARLDGKSDVE